MFTNKGRFSIRKEERSLESKEKKSGHKLKKVNAEVMSIKSWFQGTWESFS